MRTVVWCALVCMACVLTGCQKHVKSSDQERDTLVGAPPSRQQDPFASQVKPPDSARVPTSGVMELPEDRSQTPRPALAREAQPEQVPEERAPTIERAPEPEDPEAVSTPEIVQTHKCFSCVQICPLSDRSGDCSESREDVICGWGTSGTLGDARELARAECDATLDMAREMPRFSRIDGACPAATCMPD